MPVIMIRSVDLDRALADRVRAYKTACGLSTSAAAAQLLAIALDHLEARSAGAAKTNAGRSQAERSAAGRAAVTARWDRVRAEAESKERR